MSVFNILSVKYLTSPNITDLLLPASKIQAEEKDLYSKIYELMKCKFRDNLHGITN